MKAKGILKLGTSAPCEAWNGSLNLLFHQLSSITMSFSVCDRVAMLRVIPVVKETFFSRIMWHLSLRKLFQLIFNWRGNQSSASTWEKSGLCCIYWDAQFSKMVKKFARVFSLSLIFTVTTLESTPSLWAPLPTQTHTQNKMRLGLALSWALWGSWRMLRWGLWCTWISDVSVLID